MWHSINERSRPSDEEIEGFIKISRRLRDDMVTRLITVLMVSGLLWWTLGGAFTSIWLALIVVNESYEIYVGPRILEKTPVDLRDYYMSIANHVYGTLVWCYAALELWDTGILSHMIFGLSILIGLLTHAAFHYTASRRETMATTVPSMVSLMILPFGLLETGAFDAKDIALIALSFVILLFYFYSAGAHNLLVQSNLANTINELSSAHDELYQHRNHLSDLVEDRTRQLAEEQIKLEQSLEQERRTSELQNQFISTVCHEFRTPLAIIDGSARRTVKALSKNDLDAVPDRMETIRASVVRMTDLMERMLDASKIVNGKLVLERVDFDVIALIEKTVTARKEQSPTHQIDLTVHQSPPHFVGDAKMLESVFSNILANAVKYSTDNPNVHIVIDTEGDEFVFTCQDTGVGIPKDQIHKISERFFRASTAEGITGTGIGLNLVKQLVDQHGGQLQITSEEGAWTNVEVRLPVSANGESCSSSNAA